MGGHMGDIGVEEGGSCSDREASGGSFHMPIPSIGSLNIKNRLKNSFNLMRTNDIPEITKDTERGGRRVGVGRGAPFQERDRPNYRPQYGPENPEVS